MNPLQTQLAAGGVVAPGAHDALTAVLAHRAGFSTIYASGFAFEATQLGAPDMGVATMRELADHTARLTAAAPEVNVIVDVDTGFGGPNSVHRTVREFVRAGASAIQIEDQTDPKRCPFLGGREVVEQETAVARVKVAAAARGSDDIMIIARTDADELGFEEVVTRCRRFAEEGADLVLPMVNRLDGIAFADRSAEERMDVYVSLQEAINHPMVTLDPPPGYTAQDLFDVGVSLVVLPLISLQAAANATISYFDSLQETGSSDAYKTAHPPTLEANLEMMKILRLADFEERLQTGRSF